MKPYQSIQSLSFQSASTLRSSTIPARKRVLFLTYRFPFPLIGGDRLKSYHLLRHLSTVADVDLISLDEWNSGHGENLKEICTFCKNVTVVPFKKAAAWSRVVFTLPTATPVEYGYYDCPQMQRAVDEAMDKNNYDLIVCFFLRTAIYVKHIADIPKLLIAEDMRLLMQERSSDTFSLSGEYIIRKNDARKLRTYEPEAMRHFDLVTFVAKPDLEMAVSLAPSLNAMILTNGVDTEKMSFYEGKRENTILFAGVLSVHHNKVMAERLVRSIYPMIRAASPDTKLIIAGRSPDESLRKCIADTPGAELHADVQDMGTLYRKASVFVHPQTIGSGIQNKVLEAFASGCAVVTTPIGASGIDGIIDEQHALVRVSDQDISHAVVNLLDNGVKRSLIAANAKLLIDTRYTWNAIFRQFDEALESVVPDLVTTAL